MNPTWQQFLASNGAVIEDGQVRHFGDPSGEIRESASHTILSDLSHLGLIRFTGEDSETFLQGQLSNDVRLAKPDTSQYSSYCTPKGRMLASFLLWRGADGYLMQLPVALRESIQKRLTMFVLRSKVKVSDASDQYARLGVAGAGADTAINNVMNGIPQIVHGVLQLPRGSVMRLPGDNFEIITSPELAPALWRELSATCKPVGSSRWEWRQIRAGIPAILPPTQEQFVPQMVNYEAIDGVNFKKGCYPGQEIVARTQYLGKLKRRMFLAHLACDSAPAPGDELFSADMETQSSGMIVNAQPSPDGGYDVLAVAQTSSVEAGDMYWKALDGPVLKMLPLPYPLA